MKGGDSPHDGRLHRRRCPPWLSGVDSWRAERRRADVCNGPVLAGHRHSPSVIISNRHLACLHAVPRRPRLRGGRGLMSISQGDEAEPDFDRQRRFTQLLRLESCSFGPYPQTKAAHSSTARSCSGSLVRPARPQLWPSIARSVLPSTLTRCPTLGTVDWRTVRIEPSAMRTRTS